MKKNKGSGGPQIAEFYNPGPKWTLGLPGERKRNMAKRKKKGGRRRNTAAVRNSGSAAYKRTPAPKSNPKRRGGRKRNGMSLRNPFSGGVGGLKFTDLVGGAAGLVIGEAVNQIIPGWLGIGIQLGGAIVLPSVLPKSIGPSAALVMGANAVKNGVNKLFDVSGLINRSVQGLIPAPGQSQMGPGVAGLRGLVTIPPSSILAGRVS